MEGIASRAASPRSKPHVRVFGSEAARGSQAPPPFEDAPPDAHPANEAAALCGLDRAEELAGGM
eukprot:CAMPEP_0170436210 /NCGR_PEP_ID=MMETSP0117_2-20130122/44022_1 /TAXON_ID=400756 /ORGANISM="Durinskia baltica, Strain CSIRO CS-38" /LENGTH=63 /DNA_ID=CAMNT_0010696235 /DNA_START=23 /DNA_END=214 /DNA_ORIENTATION=+